MTFNQVLKDLPDGSIGRAMTLSRQWINWEAKTLNAQYSKFTFQGGANHIELISVIVYFFVGLVWDALITIDTYYIIKGKYIGVFVTSFVLTVLGVTVFTEILDEMTTWEIIGLAFGSGLGAGVTVWYNSKRSK
jgi:hypothetical protein